VESEPGGNWIGLCIEIYNYGNGISKNIKVIVEGKDLATIEYLKPNESHLVCFSLAYVRNNCNGDRLMDIVGIRPQGDVLPLILEIDGKEKHFTVDITNYSNNKSIPNNTVTALDDISRHLEEIKRVLNGTLAKQ